MVSAISPLISSVIIFLAPSLLLSAFHICSASRPLTASLNEEASMKQQLIKYSDSSSQLIGDPSNPIWPTFGSVQEPEPPSGTFTNFTPIFPFPSVPNIPPFPFVPTLPTIPTFPSIPSVPLPGFEDSGDLVPGDGRP